MIDPYVLLKWVHILSSTLLFGTGIGTAFHMWLAYRGGSVEQLALAARSTVLADWLFTLPSGIVQPASGLALIWFAGWSLWEPWLVLSYGLYLLALACWLPVVGIQIKVARLAHHAAATGAALPEDCHRLMRLWFRLGWPAFIGLLVIFWLMVAKPDLW